MSKFWLVVGVAVVLFVLYVILSRWLFLSGGHFG
jgi:hypothetical protein